jgi:hypothetical protein
LTGFVGAGYTAAKNAGNRRFVDRRFFSKATATKQPSRD